MKGLNKLALATAVAAVPFASQAMEPMSDKAMGETTGQAGVTIELDTQISIDQIEYSQGTNTGSFLVNTIDIGGTNIGSGFGEGLDLAINVDLPEGGEQSTAFGSNGLATGGNGVALNDGDAIITVKNQANDGSAPVDLAVDVDSMGLESSDGSNSATLISNVNLDVYLSQLDIIARNDSVTDAAGNTVGSDANGALEVQAAFAIDDLDMDIDVASVGIQNLQMAGAGTLTQLQQGAPAGAGATADPNNITPAVVSMDIGTGDAANGDIAEALNVNISNFTADIWMPTITVGNNNNGGSSIGSVGIDNLSLTNTQIAVYGRA